ncbi:MAG TPA: Wzz/FepE/Etk N-terminal domain-containing protein [Bryobacteraceae bacterium]|jgi:succinoglycan biosynthesis transport protein ExoP|nr:Wzz/FepE/Etk N-terminal domain-containing protein [Bryobacteraceae bacterium]
MTTKKAGTKMEVSPLSLARMLWKEKILIGIVAVLGCAIAIGIVMRLPAVYQSEAVILVDSQKIPEHYVESTVNTNVQDRLATISQQMLSATRLQKIIDTFGLYSKERKTAVQEEIIDRMRKDITIKLERGWTGGQPGAFRVGYQGDNPTLITQVANQIANLFIEENLRTRERQAEGTADFIDSQLGEAKKKLDQLESKLSAYKVQYNGELPQQESFLTSTLDRFQTELQGNQDATNRAQQNRLMLQNTLSMAEAEETVLALRQKQAKSDDGGTVSSGSERGGAAPARVKRSELLKQQYEALLVRYQPDYPDLVRLKSEIERQKKVEEDEDKQSAKASAPVPAPAGASGATTARLAPVAPPAPPSIELMHARERVETIKSQITLADRELAMREADRQQIRKQMSLYQGRIEKLPLREQEMAAVMRDYEISKANYKSLLDKKLSAGMASDMERRQQGERFTLLDPARVPEKPVKPNRPLFAGIGCAVVLILAFAIGFAREATKNQILGEWEIAGDMPILGRVPFIDPAVRSS